MDCYFSLLISLAIGYLVRYVPVDALSLFIPEKNCSLEWNVRCFYSKAISDFHVIVILKNTRISQNTFTPTWLRSKSSLFSRHV